MPLGIPHSTFLSWPLDDQDKALAYQAVQRETCPDCGTRGDHWQHEDGTPDPQALVAEETVCLGCAAAAKARAGVDPDDSAGVRIRLTRPTQP